MGTYDASIGVPISGQPISSGGYGVPVRNAILDLDNRVGIREAATQLPASASATSNAAAGTFSASAGVWAVLPGNPLSLNFTNPSTVFTLVCNVYFGAWMRNSTSTTLSTTQARFGLQLSGGVTATVGVPGANQPTGWGMYPATTNPQLDQHNGFFQMLIPPSVAAVTLTAMGYRSAATFVEFMYPTINVVPDRYQL